MNWADLSGRLKAYILALTGLSLPIALYAVWNLFTHPPDSGWILLAALAILTVPLSILIESANASISIGDAFIMAIAMIYGTAPCIITTFLHTLSVTLFARRKTTVPTYRIVFNVSSTVIVACLYSWVYHKLIGQAATKTEIILCSAIMIAVYFVANSSLVSIAISWSNKESFLHYWAKTCLPLIFEFPASAAVATGMVMAQKVIVGGYWHLIIAPLIIVVWGYYKMNRTRMLLHQARITETENHLKEQEQLYMRTVESLALAVDAKDQTTYGHIRRVRVYAIELAKLCGIKDPDEFRAIETGSLLHDIGKLAIDDYILNKPGKLTKQEFEKIKMHAAAGDEILQQVRFPFPVARYVRYHHERWDGNGYPDGLKGEEIPLGARILSVADAFDAIRFSRPYKLSMATEEAIEILSSQSGTFFDPNLVQLLREHIGELEQIAVREAENAPELSFRKYFETAEQFPSAPAPSAEAAQDIPAEMIQLAEFCSTMGGYFDLKDILPTFLHQLERIVPFNTCVLYLDNNGVRLETACAVGKFSDLLQKHHIEIGRGISGWVAAYRRPICNTGPALDFKGIQSDFTSLKDALVVPIVREDETLGTISLYAEEASVYGHEHMSTMQTLAGLMAPWIAESRKHGPSAAKDTVDPTTRIPRISYLAAVGPQLISSAGNNRSPISLIYLDIRNLAQINRVYGGEMGNSLLGKISECIKPELRETDILVRYGSQGFVAFLPGVRDEQATRCALRLRQQIKREVSVAGHNITIDCRTGIAAYPKDGATVIALLQSAQESIQAATSETAAPDRNVVDFFPRV